MSPRPKHVMPLLAAASIGLILIFLYNQAFGG